MERSADREGKSTIKTWNQVYAEALYCIAKSIGIGNYLWRSAGISCILCLAFTVVLIIQARNFRRLKDERLSGVCVLNLATGDRIEINKHEFRCNADLPGLKHQSQAFFILLHPAITAIFLACFMLQYFSIYVCSDGTWKLEFTLRSVPPEALHRILTECY